MNANMNVELGEIIFWFPEGDVCMKPTAAMVTAIGMDAVDVALFQPGNERHQVRLGARHVDDKRSRAEELREAGGWCHRRDWFSRGEVSDELKAAAGGAEAKENLNARGKAAAKAAQMRESRAQDRALEARAEVVK